ncbi:MAG: hypothetical protein Tsb005_13830 [Gammaproteobacteria bacterium]
MMIHNRRNYYRILQVQPDAPLEIIKASYRTLMLKLKQHPDLGGDHWNAALINEAYAVLKDAAKRAAYDKELLTKYVHAQHQHPAIHHYCVFCKTPHADTVITGDCVECHSPLANAMAENNELARELARLPRHQAVTYYEQWPQIGSEGEMVDISPKGLGLYTQRLLTVDQMIKLECELLRAVGRVVHVTEQNNDERFNYLIGIEFVAVNFHTRLGSFISTSA